MREIALDTETTGLDPKAGHRVVEIGCVEMINHVATGEVFHCYINPERDMPEEAFAVHGLSEEFLRDHPLFAAVADGFIQFIGDAPLVIHNASFDLGFLNAELEKVGRPRLEMERALDTVRMARKRFPGAPASLDALCKRFNIDNSSRELHGALLDAQLLADVYLELNGGRQAGLDLSQADIGSATASGSVLTERKQRDPRAFAPSPEEKTRHAAFIATLTDPLWNQN